jgi:hypothetical protein
MYLFLITAVPIGLLYVITDLAAKGTRSASWRAAIKGAFIGALAFFLASALSDLLIPRYESATVIFYLWLKYLLVPIAPIAGGFFLFYRYKDGMEGKDPPWTAICYHSGAFSMVAFFTFFQYQGAPTLFMTMLYPLLLVAASILIPACFEFGQRAGGTKGVLWPLAIIPASFFLALVPWLETAKLAFWSILPTIGACVLAVFVVLGKARRPSAEKRPLISLESQI